MKILPLIAISTLLLLSCENKNSAISESKKDAKTEVTTNTESEQSAVQTVASEQPQTADVSVAKTAERPALNPPHGEPFHRCDIQVGAPIDSAPQQTAVPQTLTQQGMAPNNNFNTTPIAPSVPAATSDNSGPKPALNPPHGEPHHRCDIQVGAPLT